MYIQPRYQACIFHLEGETSHVSLQNDSVKLGYGYHKKRLDELAQYNSLAGIDGMTPANLEEIDIHWRNDIRRR